MRRADFVVGNRYDAWGVELAKVSGAGYIPFDQKTYPDGATYPLIDPVKAELVSGKNVAVPYRLSQEATDVDVMRMLHYAPRVVRSLKNDYGARKVAAILPYFPLSRQDKPPTGKDFGKDSGHAFVMELFSSMGADEIVTFNPHFAKVNGGSIFHRDLCHVRALSAVPLLAEYVRDHVPNYEDAVVVGPDIDSAGFVASLGDELGIEHTNLEKKRLGERDVVHYGTFNAEGRPTIIADDMISTGGTISGAVDSILGASDVRVVAVHGVLPEVGMRSMQGLLETGKISGLAVTDTVHSRFAKISIVEYTAFNL